MATYNYIISKRVHYKIYSFYANVFKKYKHTYSSDNMYNDINAAYNSIYQIENGSLRRNPTLTRWKSKGYLMANTKKWYFAYRIEGDTIYVEDACHSQNMHEAMEEDKLNALITESLRKTLLKYA